MSAVTSGDEAAEPVGPSPDRSLILLLIERPFPFAHTDRRNAISDQVGDRPRLAHEAIDSNQQAQTLRFQIGAPRKSSR